LIFGFDHQSLALFRFAQSATEQLNLASLYVC
jgi:hypothetical protein